VPRPSLKENYNYIFHNKRLTSFSSTARAVVVVVGVPPPLEGATTKM